MAELFFESAFTILAELCYIILTLAIIRHRYHYYSSFFLLLKNAAEEIKGQCLILQMSQTLQKKTPGSDAEFEPPHHPAFHTSRVT
jgi:hypothetical protein